MYYDYHRVAHKNKKIKIKKRGTKKKFVENVNGDNVYRWRDVTAVHRRPHNATKPRARAQLFVFPLVIASIYSNYFSAPGCDVTSGEDDYLRQGKRGGGRGGSGRSKRRARKYNNGKKRIPTQKTTKTDSWIWKWGERKREGEEGVACVRGKLWLPRPARPRCAAASPPISLSLASSLLASAAACVGGAVGANAPETPRREDGCSHISAGKEAEAAGAPIY